MTMEPSIQPAAPSPTNDEPKFGQFFALEFCLYLAQVAVLYIVIYMMTNMLANEATVNRVLLPRIEDKMPELGFTIVGLIAVFGLIGMVRHYTPNGLVHRIADAVMDEFPRTIYLFGANLTSVCLAGATYLLSTPEPDSANKFFAYAAFFSLMLFGMGFVLKGLQRAAASKRVA